MIVDKNKIELRTLAKQYDSEGLHPYHGYFKAMKGFNFTIKDLTEEQKKYFDNIILPRMLKTL